MALHVLQRIGIPCDNVVEDLVVGQAVLAVGRLSGEYVSGILRYVVLRRILILDRQVLLEHNGGVPDGKVEAVDLVPGEVILHGGEHLICFQEVVAVHEDSVQIRIVGIEVGIVPLVLVLTDDAVFNDVRGIGFLYVDNAHFVDVPVVMGVKGLRADRCCEHGRDHHGADEHRK